MKDSIRGGFGIAMVQALTGLTHLVMGLQDLSLCFSVDPGLVNLLCPLVGHYFSERMWEVSSLGKLMKCFE